MYGVAGLLLDSIRSEVKSQSTPAAGPWLKDKQDWVYHKVECAFPMVVVSLLPIRTRRYYS